MKEEHNTTDEYIEVDSIKEARLLFMAKCLYYSIDGSNKREKIKLLNCDDPLLSENLFKLNPHYCEYREGQLIYYQGYFKRYCEGLDNSKIEEIKENEERTLMPQVFDRIVEDLEGIDYRNLAVEPYEIAERIDNLIKKYRGDK